MSNIADVIVKFLDKIRIKSIVLSLVDSIDLSFDQSINQYECLQGDV